MIIGVSGRNGSGKGALLEELARRGFVVFSLSDVLRRELAEQGVAETRERMIELGTSLRREKGPGALAEAVIGQLEEGVSYGVDSIRHPAEVEILAANEPRFRLIWVEAPAELRLERMRERGRPGDPETLAELTRLEDLEKGGGDPATQQVEAIRKQADFVVSNEGPLEALASALDPILKSLE